MSRITDSEDFDYGSDISVQPWIQQLLRFPGNSILCEVPLYWIDEPFNLCGLDQIVPYYDRALEVILDVDDAENSAIQDAARLLYAMLHARYILCPQGMNEMRKKFRRGDFGRCPRVLCRHHKLLPVAIHEYPGVEYVRFFCQSCQTVYRPFDPVFTGVDGVFFGKSFPHLFFMSFEDLRPKSSNISYVPRIFGFKIGLKHLEHLQKLDDEKAARQIEYEKVAGKNHTIDQESAAVNSLDGQNMEASSLQGEKQTQPRAKNVAEKKSTDKKESKRKDKHSRHDR